MTRDNDDAGVHDAGVAVPRVRVAILLAVVRLLAGRRGYATVEWSGQGFRYQLYAYRDLDPDPLVIDGDPQVPPGDLIRRLGRHLQTR